MKPGIHEKIKRFSNGKKKLITKRIPVDVDYLRAMDEGLIIIENCFSCWKTTDDEKQEDVMVVHLLCYLFLRYQEEGNIPEYIGYYVKEQVPVSTKTELFLLISDMKRNLRKKN